MPRSLSWLDRIVPILRTVQESARSHYDRKELQRLFELQPRSAQQLMAALPSISIGRAHLVEREALSDFLRRLNESENPAKTLALMRAGGGKTVRRKLREVLAPGLPRVGRRAAPHDDDRTGRPESSVPNARRARRGHALSGHRLHP